MGWIITAMPSPTAACPASLGLFDRIAPDGGNRDLDEGVLLGSVAGRAGGAQRLDALLEEGGVLLLDRLPDLGEGPLEEELLAALPVDGPPPDAELHPLAHLLRHLRVI